MESGIRLSPLRLGGLQRGTHSLHPRRGLTGAAAATEQLHALDAHLPVGTPHGAGRALFWSPVHAPVLTRLDRLPRAARRLHAREAQRLLREYLPRRRTSARLLRP